MKSLVICSSLALILLLSVNAEEPATEKVEDDPQRAALAVFCKIKCRSKQCPQICSQKLLGSFSKRMSPMGSVGLGDLRFDDYLFMKLLGRDI